MKIEDLFQLNKEFRSFEYICGKKGSEKIINNIEVIEVPDGVYWAKEGDFLVTTGYFIKKDEIVFENFIKMLIYHKAAGLGIKLGRFIERIPNKIIQIAEANSFPIIKIPLHMRYSSILWPVANKLINNENYDNYILKKYRKELKEVMKTSYNVSAITDLISIYIGYPVGIFWSVNKKQINITEDLKINNMLDILKTESNNMFKPEETVALIKKEEGNYYFLKVEAVNQLIAYICILANNNTELTETDIAIIEETLPFISVYLLSSPNKNLNHYKSLDEFFLNVMEGDYVGNEIKLKEEATYLDVVYSKSRFVWLIEIPGLSKNDYNRLVKSVKTFLDLYNREYYMIEKRKRILFISSINVEQLSDKFVTEFFLELLKNIEYSFKNLNFNIGISKICSSLKNLNFAYEEAIFAYKLGRKIKPDDKIYYYDNYMIYHLLYEVSNHPTLSKIYRNTIERITKYDNEYKAELFDTIIALIKNDFNINQTSNSLFIHRNTLYKRINKINNLLDFNLEKSESRLILQLAVKLYEILD